MKRYISCFLVVLLSFLNISSFSAYASQENNTSARDITINICNYDEDTPYACVAIMQDNTLYLKGEDISRITNYSYWGESLLSTPKDEYGELFSLPPDDPYTDFRGISTVYYNPITNTIRSLGYEYDYHHLTFQDSFYYPFEMTMYLLHCQWCIDNGVLYVRTLGDNIIDFVLRHGVDMLKEQPTRGDLLVEGENNVVKYIAEMAHSYDSRLFIIGWGLNNKIEEDFENALLAYNLPDIDFLNNIDTESTSEMVEAFENDFDKLATVVGAGKNIDEKINIIRKAMSKSPKSKMNKWNDISLFTIPELEQAGEVLEGVNDVFKILDYGMKMYELSTRSSGWNRDFLSEIKLLSEQDEKSLGISLTNEGQNVINAAKNIWNQYKGDNKIVDDYSVISGGGLIADKLFDMTPESLLVKGVQLANTAMQIKNKDYKNTMDAYGLEFDAKYADRVVTIAQLIFSSHFNQLYQFATSNNSTKLSKKYIQDLYTSTELYLRASFRQSVYVYEVKRMLSKDDNWENSAEGMLWKNKINKYQKLLTELNYTTYYNSNNERNYYEKLILIDNIDNYYSDEYGCIRVRLTEEDIKSLEISAKSTSSHVENFDEKNLRNMDSIAESIIYHCIETETDSWKPDTNNAEFYWDVMCFYSNFEYYTFDFSEADGYYIVPNYIIMNASYACFEDFNGIFPPLNDDIWRAKYYDSESTLLVGGDSGIKEIRLSSYKINKDESVDAIYSIVFWGDEEDEPSSFYQIHYLENPHCNDIDSNSKYYFTADNVTRISESEIELDKNDDKNRKEEKRQSNVVDIRDPILKNAIQETLQIGDRDITETDALQLTALEYYPFDDYSMIKDISGISAFTNLTSLNLGGNEIKDIGELNNLTKLTYLDLSDNQIDNISNLSNLKELTYLNLSGNELDDISSLSGLKNLTTLDLSSTGITDISNLSGLTELTDLTLVSNYITDISGLTRLTNMTSLNLSDNQIDDIRPLSNMKKLTALYLSYNNVDNIEAISDLINLKSLWLGSNLISDISPLAKLTNLVSLDLSNYPYGDYSNNQITDIGALSGLTKLEQLNLSLNPVLEFYTSEEIMDELSGATELDIIF